MASEVRCTHHDPQGYHCHRVRMRGDTMCFGHSPAAAGLRNGKTKAELIEDNTDLRAALTEAIELADELTSLVPLAATAERYQQKLARLKAVRDGKEVGGGEL